MPIFFDDLLSTSGRVEMWHLLQSLPNSAIRQLGYRHARKDLRARACGAPALDPQQQPTKCGRSMTYFFNSQGTEKKSAYFC